MKKRQNGSDFSFVITVKEFAAPPPGQYARFFCPSRQIRQSENRALLPTAGAIPFGRTLCLPKMILISRMKS